MYSVEVRPQKDVDRTSIRRRGTVKRLCSLSWEDELFEVNKPFLYSLIAFTQVAKGTSQNNILRTIGATFRNRDHMVNMVFMQMLVAPIAFGMLFIVLILHISCGVIPTISLHQLLPISIARITFRSVRSCISTPLRSNGFSISFLVHEFLPLHFVSIFRCILFCPFANTNFAFTSQSTFDILGTPFPKVFFDCRFDLFALGAFFHPWRWGVQCSGGLFHSRFLMTTFPILCIQAFLTTGSKSSFPSMEVVGIIRFYLIARSATLATIGNRVFCFLDIAALFASTIQTILACSEVMKKLFSCRLHRSAGRTLFMPYRNGFILPRYGCAFSTVGKETTAIGTPKKLFSCKFLLFTYNASLVAIWYRIFSFSYACALFAIGVKTSTSRRAKEYTRSRFLNSASVAAFQGNVRGIIHNLTPLWLAHPCFFVAREARDFLFARVNYSLLGNNSIIAFLLFSQYMESENSFGRLHQPYPTS